ncbi:MAG: hypothetical protein HFH00_11825 [Dorea sp.]|nr:hypothetical protein [Dorea sp.]
MKRVEYSINEIQYNLKKNIKSMIVVFAFIFLTGSCVGIVKNMNYGQQEFTLDDTIVETVDFSSFTEDERYYYNAFSELKNKYNALNAYALYLRQVDMSNESSNKLALFIDDLSQFKQANFDKLAGFYTYNTPIICDDMPKAEEFIKDNIGQNERKIAASDKSIERLNNHSFSKIFIQSSEAKELEKIQSAENEKEFWERQLNMIHSANLNEIEKINENMDQLLQNAEWELNGLVSLFNKFIIDIEEQEQYDIVYNKYLLKSYLTVAGVTGELSEEDIMNNRRNSAVIYAKSIAGLDMAKERVFSFLTFFMLFGVTVAFLYGFFYKVKK